MSKRQNNDLKYYVVQVASHIPDFLEGKSGLLEQFASDMKEAVKDAGKGPMELFGTPQHTARNLCSDLKDAYQDAPWKNRGIAYFIDFILVWGFIGLFYGFPHFYFDFVALAESPDTSLAVKAFIYIYGLTVLGLGMSIYFLPEKLFATSVGKKIFGMHVVDNEFVMISWRQAILRNFFKFNSEILPIDIILGLLMNREGEPFLKASDYLAKTRIVQKMN